MKIKKTLLALLLGSSAFLFAGSLGAQELPVIETAEVVEAVADAISFEDGYAAFMETPGAAFFTISNLWLLIAAALVFIMHLGFATVESGLGQAKNTVNILFKNVDRVLGLGQATFKRGEAKVHDENQRCSNADPEIVDREGRIAL